MISTVFRIRCGIRGLSCWCIEGTAAVVALVSAAPLHCNITVWKDKPLIETVHSRRAGPGRGARGRLDATSRGLAIPSVNNNVHWPNMCSRELAAVTGHRSPCGPVPWSRSPPSAPGMGLGLLRLPDTHAYQALFFIYWKNSFYLLKQLYSFVSIYHD